MARNTGDEQRKGTVKDRTQTENPLTGTFTKRDTKTGEFIDVKEDDKPFKGVAKEEDGRRTKKSED